MAGPLESVARQMFDAIDKGDPLRVIPLASDDLQGIDELAGRWIRNPSEVQEYFGRFASMVSDVHSEIVDPHEREWGDVGLLTFWLEQDYTMQGERRHVSAPSTMVCRRENGSWKVALFHSVPVPGNG
jgi:ketosteroid isomerase-like protein